jgi:hypothetical protein
MTPSIAYGNGDHAARDNTKISISEIAASIGSRLARSRDGSAAYSDPQHAAASVLDELSCACDGGRLDEGTEPKPVTAQIVAPQMSYDQLHRTNPRSDEYRERVDACLNWAREAPTDEVRLACLTLAQAWLRAAMRDVGDVSDSLPLAPKL